MTDGNTVRRLMEDNSQVRQGWSSFLDDAKIMRGDDEVERTAAYARLRTRSPELLPLLDEIQGKRVAISDTGKTTVKYGKPIGATGDAEADYRELVDYVVNQNALSRLGVG